MPTRSPQHLDQEFGLHLRELCEKDHAAISRLLADRAMQHLLLAYPPEEGAADLNGWVSRRTDNPGLQFRVVTNSREEFCGFLQAGNIHFRGRIGWLGMALDPVWRGKGVGRWALLASFAWARDELGLRKILLEVRADNAAAVGLYRGEGFRDVGVMRDHYDDGTSLHDVLVLEKLLGDPVAQGEAP